MARLGRVTVKEIFVKNDSDPSGSGELSFSMIVRGSEYPIGKYDVGSGKTLRINKVFDDIGLADDVIDIKFRGIDDDSSIFWDDLGEDRAENNFKLDRRQFPLPQDSLWIRAAGDDGLNFTVYYSVEHRGVFEGARLWFTCLGSVPGRKYLSRTADYEHVILENDFDANKDVWLASDLGDGSFGFKLAGSNSWLDGNTVNGSVSLAPHTNSPYTGTHWRVHYVDGDGRIRLECLGNVDGPRWLDGNTINGVVKLVWTTGPEHSGATWKI